MQVIGYLFGQYKRLRNEWVGVLTGKPFGFGGSNIRPEATGYGLVYFTQSILEDRLGTDIKGKRVAVSGSGNVAQFAVEKLLELGAVPVSMSDSSGAVIEPEGFTIEGLHKVMKIKEKRGSLKEYTPSDKGAQPLRHRASCRAFHGTAPLACCTFNGTRCNDLMQ